MQDRARYHTKQCDGTDKRRRSLGKKGRRTGHAVRRKQGRLRALILPAPQSGGVSCTHNKTISVNKHEGGDTGSHKCERRWELTPLSLDKL